MLSLPFPKFTFMCFGEGFHFFKQKKERKMKTKF